MEKATSLSAMSPHGHSTIYFRYWEKYFIIQATFLVCDHVKIGTVLLSAFRQSYWLHGIVRASAWGLLCKIEAFGVWKNIKIHFKRLLLLKTKPKQHPPSNNKIINSLKSQNPENPSDQEVLLFSAAAPDFNLIVIEE